MPTNNPRFSPSRLSIGRRITLITVVVVLLVLGAFAVYFVTQENGIGSASSAAAKERTVTYMVSSSPNEAVNQVGEELTVVQTNAPIWLGANSGTVQSYLALRFSGAVMPANVQIVKAELQIVSAQDQNANIGGIIVAENEAAPKPFSIDNKPSQRMVTTSSSAYSNAADWSKGTTYGLDVTPVVQEVVSANPSHALGAIILIAKSNIFDSSYRTISDAHLVVTYRLPE